jgi:DNA-binding MarR family transcriptional regulator
MTQSPTLGSSPTPAGPWHRTPRSQAQYKTYLAILQAAEAFQREFVELFKTAELSFPQYNVLRILRGAGPDGLACGEVAERLIRHDPDMTRLLDRLERRGLTARTREQRDRRVVRTHITATGLAILASLDEAVDALHERQLGHLSEAELAALTSLLENARARTEAAAP